MSRKCIAKAVETLDGNFTLNKEYDCEDTGEYYILLDDNGGKHNILRNGMLVKHFIILDY